MFQFQSEGPTLNLWLWSHKKWKTNNSLMQTSADIQKRFSRFLAAHAPPLRGNWEKHKKKIYPRLPSDFLSSRDMPWCALPWQFDVRRGPDQQRLLRHVQPRVSWGDITWPVPVRQRRHRLRQRLPLTESHVPAGQIDWRGLWGQMHQWVTWWKNTKVSRADSFSANIPNQSWPFLLPWQWLAIIILHRKVVGV